MHITPVFTQIFTLYSNVDYLHIVTSDEHPSGHDDINSTDWLAFFRLFPTVKMLHILSVQVASALEDVLGEMVTVVFLSLHSIVLEDPEPPLPSSLSRCAGSMDVL